MLVTSALRLKGLGHEDFFVRSGVLESFEHDLNPQVSVTKAAIAAIQRYGWQDTFEWPHMLTGLPQDQTTIDWTLQQLSERSCRAPSTNMRLHLAHWFSQAPVVLISPNLERLEAAFAGRKQTDGRLHLAHYVEAAKERLQFASETAAQCLLRLERTCAGCARAEGFPQALVLRAERLCDHLARTGDRTRLAELVSRWLACDLTGEGGMEQWRAGMAIRLAGLLQLRGALPRLIEMFQVDWDWWDEEIEQAVAAMNNKAVLSRIVRQFPVLPWNTRNYLSGALTKARFGGVEECLLRLLEVESDSWIRINVGKALALYGSTSSMKTACDLLEEHGADLDASAIMETLYAFYRVAGAGQPTQLARWRSMLEISYQRYKRTRLEEN